jgi:hypothetical protein
MSCCGKNRGAVQGIAVNPRMLASQSAARHSGVMFEYVGESGLTATGGFTGRTYVFPSPGAKVTADRRDALSLRTIPVLRQVL